MAKYDVIIIGAGASGLIATEIAGRNNKDVLLLEKMEQAGRKLRITGKGRCNITNVSSPGDFVKHVGSDGRFLRNAFSIFFVEELMEYFKEIGLPLKVERGNRVFPTSDKAQDVFLRLIERIEKYKNVSILKNTSVSEIIAFKNEVRGVKLDDGISIFADKVLLATGGLSYPLTGSTGDGYKMAEMLGHSVSERFPALVPLISKESIVSAVVDFTVKNANISVFEEEKKIHEAFGEMKFTENGIGGPIVLTLSRYLTKGLHEDKEYLVKIDFKSALDREELDKEIMYELEFRGGMFFYEVAHRWLPEELIMLMFAYTKISKKKKCYQLSKTERKLFLTFLKEFPLRIVATRDYDEAIITQGGIALKEINPKTMESKLIKNLFFSGEVMDLDADTGGYNLQIAFTTGYVAGMNL